MPGPDIGVIIATRNRAASLAATLGRLSELPEQPRLLVVDNASTDGTADMVSARFPAVQLITLSTNRGALARNDGARLLDTEYVAFSDDDSWWEPGALRAGARILDAHPDVGLLAARTLVEPDGEPDPLNAALADSPLGTADYLPGPRVLGFLGCAAIARRSAFLAAGGYHPVLFFGAEETLLAYDLTARGWQVCYVPEVVARHHPDAGPRVTRDTLVRRNELLTAWLRRPLPVALGRTARLLGDAPRNRDARAALYGVARRLPKAVARRRRLPTSVERAVRQLEASREAIRPEAATARAVAAGAAGPIGPTVVPDTPVPGASRAGEFGSGGPGTGPPVGAGVPDAADLNVASEPPETAADPDVASEPPEPGETTAPGTPPPDGRRRAADQPGRKSARNPGRRRWRPRRRGPVDPGQWCTTPSRARPGAHDDG